MCAGNDAIMDFARVFTGFDEQRDRGNLEYVDGKNRIDPMQMKAHSQLDTSVAIHSRSFKHFVVQHNAKFFVTRAQRVTSSLK